MKRILSAVLAAIFLAACAPQVPDVTGTATLQIPEVTAIAATETVAPQRASMVDLQYAEQFTMETRADGCTLVTIAGSDRFLVVPEGQDAPVVDADVTVLQQPLANIYIAATSAMCLFDGLDALDNIAFSGTKQDGWSIANARDAMTRGDIVYAGKYNAPDYELLLANKCGLALESTMLTHAPEVKEKLEALGIPVLMERSSYETHPLGRTEWIKLYGLLTGKLALAEELFAAQAAHLDALSAASTGQIVAFFHISSNGNAVVRRSGDYVTTMLTLAGGQYAFPDTGGGSATGTVNLNMEQFYAAAKNADVLIYNSAIDGELRTLAEFLGKSPLLADCKAVQSGNVWCTGKNMFQETTEFGLMMTEMNRVFTGDADDALRFFHRLR